MNNQESKMKDRFGRDLNIDDRMIYVTATGSTSNTDFGTIRDWGMRAGKPTAIVILDGNPDYLTPATAPDKRSISSESRLIKWEEFSASDVVTRVGELVEKSRKKHPRAAGDKGPLRLARARTQAIEAVHHDLKRMFE